MAKTEPFHSLGLKIDKVDAAVPLPSGVRSVGVPWFTAETWPRLREVVSPDEADKLILWLIGAEQPALKRLVFYNLNEGGNIESVIIVEQLEPPRRYSIRPSRVRAMQKVIGKLEGGAS